jgi:hypothetical protein
MDRLTNAVFRGDSANLNDSDTLSDPIDDLGQPGHEPFPEDPIAAVANAQPNDDRALERPLRPRRKVFVLGHDRRTDRQSVVPDLAIFSLA